jgi:hypothetical protein
MPPTTKGNNIAEDIVEIQPIAIKWAPSSGERRRSTRYNCVGVVEILRIQKTPGEFVTGKIRNLSLEGCCIETQAPLERGPQLAVILQVNTLRVRVIAEIRSVEVDGHFSAGLEFVGMTVLGLRNLQGLIAESNQKE